MKLIRSIALLGVISMLSGCIIHDGYRGHHHGGPGYHHGGHHGHHRGW
ncbi:hypothetical protein [Erwinia sp. 198]|nr:hypothetical protein [Erwinia sp. 198]